MPDHRSIRGFRISSWSPDRTRGEKYADIAASFLGSWAFIIIQSIIMALWISLNLIAWHLRWDPFPFILLNLALSTQAAFAAPMILLSQNRQSEIDRTTAEHDYRINQVALQYMISIHAALHGSECHCWRHNVQETANLLSDLSKDLP